MRIYTDCDNGYLHVQDSICTMFIMVMICCGSLCEECGSLMDDDKMRYHNDSMMVATTGIFLFCE